MRNDVADAPVGSEGGRGPSALSTGDNGAAADGKATFAPAQWRGLQAPGKQQEKEKFRFLVNNGRANPHDSPHFQRGPKVSAKTGSSASMTANRSINGSSLSSGMVDINS